MHKFPDRNTKACKINVHVHVHVVCDVYTCTCKISACMYMCNVHNSDDMGNANVDAKCLYCVQLQIKNQEVRGYQEKVH